MKCQNLNFYQAITLEPIYTLNHIWYCFSFDYNFLISLHGLRPHYKYINRSQRLIVVRPLHSDIFMFINRNCCPLGTGKIWNIIQEICWVYGLRSYIWVISFGLQRLSVNWAVKTQRVWCVRTHMESVRKLWQKYLSFNYFFFTFPRDNDPYHPYKFISFPI